MKSAHYFNPIWSKTRQGLNIPLWASVDPADLTAAPANPLDETDAGLVFFIGGVHGDEPEGVWLAEALLNQILTLELRKTHQRTQRQSYSPSRPREKSLFKRPWALIPCLNPEGFALNERTNSAGVDLNRNFPSDDWSPEIKAPRYHPGNAPGSEPETQALIKAFQAFQPKLIIHFHSWEPCIVYTGTPGRLVAENLSRQCGYPCREDIGYPTPGSLGQYGWNNLKTPVICIEEQEKSNRDPVWRRFQSGLMDLIR